MTGLNYEKGPDGLRVSADEETLTWWQEFVYRVAGGEDARDVLRGELDVNADK